MTTIRPQSVRRSESTATATGRRQSWAWWGVAAGVCGAVGHLITQPPAAVYAARDQSPAIIDQLQRGAFHIGGAVGIVAVMCLLVFAAGVRRWADASGHRSIAAATVPLALTASAGAMVLGYGMKGALSIYLPGGINAGSFPNEALYFYWMFTDLGPFMAWWGVAFAALMFSYLALVERRLPLWLGVVGVLGWLPPIAMLAVTGLTGFPGVVGPLWLVITAAGLAMSRRTSATDTG